MARSSRFVRASKFRHVFCEPDKPDDRFLDINLAPHSGDHYFIAASPKYFSVSIRGGGGKVLVQDLKKPGKIPLGAPMLAGHKGKVYDTQWSPFNDDLIATASEDTTVKLWNIPEGGLVEDMTESAATLRGHTKDALLLQFHPVANNVIASSSRDMHVKIWDVEKEEAKITLPAFPQLVSDMRWNQNGSLLGTTCKDKHARVFDVRTGEVTAEWEPHEGGKIVNSCWITTKGEYLTAGFTRQSHRELKFWDLRKTDEPVHSTRLDQSAGVLMPFFDADTSILYVAGRGDANVRYFEYTDEAPFIHPIDEYRSAESAKGACMLPKRSVDVSRCEVARILKLTNAKQVMGLSFIVPRKSEMYQEDLYPDCLSAVPAQTADAWFGGATVEPKRMSMDPEKTGGATATSGGSLKVDEAAAAAAAKRAEEESGAAAGGGGSGGGAASGGGAKETPAEEPKTKPTYEELERELAAAKKRIAELELAAAT